MLIFNRARVVAKFVKKTLESISMNDNLEFFFFPFSLNLKTVVDCISTMHDVSIRIVRYFVPFRRVAIANCSQCQAHRPTHGLPVFHFHSLPSNNSYAFVVCHLEWPPHNQCAQFRPNCNFE